MSYTFLCDIILLCLYKNNLKTPYKSIIVITNNKCIFLKVFLKSVFFIKYHKNFETYLLFTFKHILKSLIDNLRRENKESWSIYNCLEESKHLKLYSILCVFIILQIPYDSKLLLT